MRILVIEDEPALREQLAASLRRAGHTVDTAADGTEGLYAIRELPVDLAIVDLGLPGVAGLDVIRAARADGKRLPVLVLTARDRWQDKVAGLDAGADDYVTKPFQTEELLARVQALIRRAAGYADPVLRVGPIALDTRTQVVTVEARAIELTSFEYRLLEYLMLRAGQVVSKGELTDKLYEHDAERDSNTIEVFVGRLRRKLDPDDRLRPIETLRGRGYRLQPEATDPARA
ncbi:MAG TPA: response regulator transcription factor [Steroidobacteraceae bacterium]|nr:response regulator transcription factor [Steroidobacteraceae bacterium]